MSGQFPIAIQPVPVTVAGPQVPEDQATSVTYLDRDDTRGVITYRGVKFKPGQTLDLADFLAPKEAREAAHKLLGNRYFKVAGGPDHEKVDARQAKVEAEHEDDLAGYEPPEEMKLETPLRSANRTPPKR